MKGLLFALILFSAMNLQAKAIGDGGSVGNGGNYIALDFVHTAQKVISDVDIEKKSYPELKIEHLKGVLAKLRVMVTDEILYVDVDGIKQASTAINYPEKLLVVINIKSWNEISDDQYKHSLVFHEVLGLLRLEWSGFYGISSRYKIKAEKNNKLILSTGELIVVPTDTSSCYSWRISESQSTAPEKDVIGGYVAIPKLHIFRENPKSDVTISFIKLMTSISSRGEISTVERIYSGDELMALSDEWWNQKEPSRKGTKRKHDLFSTSCPIFLDGLPDGDSSNGDLGKGTIEIVGYEGDENSAANARPFKISDEFNIHY